ncbi:hypothetical protein [Halobacillus sp. K22]|uniref:hypothetical protein n=1 Tax=Halobacillus sp. K22 TaxID=3457431 RepID=UPI003FCC37FD
MQKTINMWVDGNEYLGIIEVKDDVFGTCYHPIKLSPEDNEEFFIINNLWYTTYNGARQFFRLHTNQYAIEGRMRKVILT